MFGNSTRRLVTALTVSMVLAGVAAAGWLFWFGRPPQIGSDEEVFNTVDALFTAVRARDERLLGECEQRLHKCGSDGKLPTEAAGYLDEVIGTARAGKWRSAAETLYHFMKAQRRPA